MELIWSTIFKTPAFYIFSLNLQGALMYVGNAAGPLHADDAVEQQFSLQLLNPRESHGVGSISLS